jgi:hypothetical protein
VADVLLPKEKTSSEKSYLKCYVEGMDMVIFKDALKKAICDTFLNNLQQIIYSMILIS